MDQNQNVPAKAYKGLTNPSDGGEAKDGCTSFDTQQDFQGWTETSDASWIRNDTNESWQRTSELRWVDDEGVEVSWVRGVTVRGGGKGKI